MNIDDALDPIARFNNPAVAAGAGMFPGTTEQPKNVLPAMDRWNRQGVAEGANEFPTLLGRAVEGGVSATLPAGELAGAVAGGVSPAVTGRNLARLPGEMSGAMDRLVHEADPDVFWNFRQKVSDVYTAVLPLYGATAAKSLGGALEELATTVRERLAKISGEEAGGQLRIRDIEALQKLKGTDADSYFDPAAEDSTASFEVGSGFGGGRTPSRVQQLVDSLRGNPEFEAEAERIYRMLVQSRSDTVTPAMRTAAESSGNDAAALARVLELHKGTDRALLGDTAEQMAAWNYYTRQIGQQTTMRGMLRGEQPVTVDRLRDLARELGEPIAIREANTGSQYVKIGRKGQGVTVRLTPPESSHASRTPNRAWFVDTETTGDIPNKTHMDAAGELYGESWPAVEERVRYVLGKPKSAAPVPSEPAPPPDPAQGEFELGSGFGGGRKRGPNYAASTFGGGFLDVTPKTREAFWKAVDRNKGNVASIARDIRKSPATVQQMMDSPLWTRRPSDVGAYTYPRRAKSAASVGNPKILENPYIDTIIRDAVRASPTYNNDGVIAGAVKRALGMDASDPRITAQMIKQRRAVLRSKGILSGAVPPPGAVGGDRVNEVLEPGAI